MYVVTIHLTDVFQALADPVRLRILRLLASPGIQESCSCDLSHALKEPEYAISRQLKVLRAAGLLEAEKEGRWIYHRIQTNHPDLRRLISLVSGFSDPDGEMEECRKRLVRLIKNRCGLRCTGQPTETSRREFKNPKPNRAERS